MPVEYTGGVGQDSRSGGLEQAIERMQSARAFIRKEPTCGRCKRAPGLVAVGAGAGWRALCRACAGAEDGERNAKTRTTRLQRAIRDAAWDRVDGCNAPSPARSTGERVWLTALFAPFNEFGATRVDGHSGRAETIKYGAFTVALRNGSCGCLTENHDPAKILALGDDALVLWEAPAGLTGMVRVSEAVARRVERGEFVGCSFGAASLEYQRAGVHSWRQIVHVNDLLEVALISRGTSPAYEQTWVRLSTANEIAGLKRIKGAA